LYFLPEPHGQRSFRPTFGTFASMLGLAINGCSTAIFSNEASLVFQLFAAEIGDRERRELTDQPSRRFYFPTVGEYHGIRERPTGLSRA
jgi:hypothetical protein